MILNSFLAGMGVGAGIGFYLTIWILDRHYRTNMARVIDEIHDKYVEALERLKNGN